MSDSQEQHAIVEQYLLAHPGATEQSIKSKARALLNEEMREHVESGTLPKRMPLPSGTVKQLAAKAFVSGSSAFGASRGKPRARAGGRTVQGQDAQG